jgi:hypothetical protein
MTLGSTFGVMAILLAETLIPFGASPKAGCQLQETGVPFADAISFQPSVVPIVGIGVIETPSHSSCFGIGVDIPQGIQHSPVVFWMNGSGVIPGFPEVPATTT